MQISIQSSVMVDEITIGMISCNGLGSCQSKVFVEELGDLEISITHDCIENVSVVFV